MSKFFDGPLPPDPPSSLPPDRRPVAALWVPISTPEAPHRAWLVPIYDLVSPVDQRGAQLAAGVLARKR